MYKHSPLHEHHMTVQEALDSLVIQLNHITLYSAGLPSYPANFTRDGILSAILMRDAKMLRDQLIYCSFLQGTKKDSKTGEEPGKIFHEMPPFLTEGYSTDYNACDTTALFLIGHDEYLNMTGDDYFIKKQHHYLEKAVTYILHHLVNYLFVEDPKYADAKRYALKVTYWKDSHISNREHGIPAYPAVFTLAHVQNMKALRSAARLLGAKDLEKKAEEMNKHLFILFDDKRGVFHIGLDQKGFFPGVSSDNLHILYYLEPDQIKTEKVRKIVEATKSLETKRGYLTLSTHDISLQHDIAHHYGYHTNTVWPFEQAFIHLGAKKFNLPHVMEVCERIIPYLHDFPELLHVDEFKVHKKGNAPQLWTIAAKKYFEASSPTL